MSDRLTCHECGRGVRNSFRDRMDHMQDYHPDKLLAQLFDPGKMYNLGASLASLMNQALEIVNGGTQTPKRRD